MYQVIIFLIVGGANTLLGLLIMYMINYFTGNPYLANITAYIVGFFSSYWAHRLITFRYGVDKNQSRIYRYGLVYIASFALNFIALKILLNYSTLSSNIIFIITSFVFALSSYGLNKAFVFNVKNQFKD